jgi:hypothetical protein
MADDVLSMLHLHPDATVIYSISLFDEAYAGDARTWAGQKQIMLDYLKEGADQKRGIRIPPQEVLSHGEDEAKKIWSVKFRDATRPDRTKHLVYYHHRSAFTEWPERVNDLVAVSIVGSLTVRDVAKNPRFERMLRTRTSTEYVLHALEFNHKVFHLHNPKITVFQKLFQERIASVTVIN